MRPDHTASHAQPLDDDPRSPSEAEQARIDAMRRLADGDETALAVLYDELAPRAWSVAVRMLGGNEESAREVVQDAFVQLWRTSSRYDPELSSVHGWLVRIVRSRAVDAVRRDQAHRRDRRQLVPIDAAELVADGADPLDCALDRDAAESVRTALADLPTEQRVLVELAFLHGYTHDELASALSVPLGTVKTRISRGLTRLRRTMRQAAAATSTETAT